MVEFKELEVGDMFNTKTERYVKVTDDKAIAVFFNLGNIIGFSLNTKVIVLYSAKLKT